jgi:hypothetical protein
MPHDGTRPMVVEVVHHDITSYGLTKQSAQATYVVAKNPLEEMTPSAARNFAKALLEAADRADGTTITFSDEPVAINIDSDAVWKGLLDLKKRRGGEGLGL